MSNQQNTPPCDTNPHEFSFLKLLRFLVIGVFFGFIMVKSEAVSWFRIYEMFRFESFHMYGIIGSALFFGVIFTYLIKKYKAKDIDHQPITFSPKASTYKRYIIGGTIFGLGWALSGACPGPMFTLLGYGYSAFIIIILSAILGTLAYGVLKDKLPH